MQQHFAIVPSPLWSRCFSSHATHRHGPLALTLDIQAGPCLWMPTLCSEGFGGPKSSTRSPRGMGQDAPKDGKHSSRTHGSSVILRRS